MTSIFWKQGRIMSYGTSVTLDIPFAALAP